MITFLIDNKWRYTRFREVPQHNKRIFALVEDMEVSSNSKNIVEPYIITCICGYGGYNELLYYPIDNKTGERGEPLDPTKYYIVAWRYCLEGDRS